MNKMNIILLSPLPPPLGGMAIWTKTYLEYFEKKSYDIELINTSMLGNDVRYNSIILEIIREIKIFKQCLKYRKKRDSIVHLNSSGHKLGIIKDYITILMLGCKNKKIVVQFHCDLSEQDFSFFSSYIMKKIICLCDEVIVLNKKSEEYIKKFGRNTVLLNNFVNDEELNKYIKKNQNTFVKDICYIGRFSEEKGSNEFIEIASRFSSINFHVYGPVECNIDIKNYKNIEFTGSLDRNELFAKASKCDIMLFLSKHEGSPLSIIEAGYIGLPIIAFDVGNIRSILSNLSIINSKDINDVIDRINSFLSCDTRELVSKINKDICSNYTISRVSKQIIDVYDSLLK